MNSTTFHQPQTRTVNRTPRSGAYPATTPAGCTPASLERRRGGQPVVILVDSVRSGAVVTVIFESGHSEQERFDTVEEALTSTKSAGLGPASLYVDGYPARPLAFFEQQRRSPRIRHLS